MGFRGKIRLFRVLRYQYCTFNAGFLDSRTISLVPVVKSVYLDWRLVALGPRSLRREYARPMKLSLQGERRARDAGKRRRPRCRVRGSERIEWSEWSAFEVWRVEMTSDGWNVTY